MRQALLGFVALTLTSIASVAQSTDPWVGTWRLDLARSTYTPGPAPRSQTVVNDPVLNGIRSLTETVDAQGNQTRQIVDAPFDGKEHEVKGSSLGNTRIFRKIDANTYEMVNFVKGKVTLTTRVAVAADGKTRIHTTTGTNIQGQTVNNVALFEKQ